MNKYLGGYKMTSKEFNGSIRSNCLGEFLDKYSNVCIIYIEYRDIDNTLVAGYVTNVGLNLITSIIYNNNLSIDANIDILWDELEELGFERIG